MKKRKLIVLLVLVCSGFSPAVFAQTYKIELVIFAQDSSTSEVFDQTESMVNWPSRMIDSTSLKNIKPENSLLYRYYRKLARGQSYQPLLHLAWYQSVNRNRLGTAVNIASPESHISGFFRIQRGNLLHLIADIEYAPDAVIYRINEKRRFKLNEIHYLDHPKFGILARISSVGQ